MSTSERQPNSADATDSNANRVVITLFAPNDDDNNPRLLRLVLSIEDGGVLTAIEDGNEDGALERAGFTGCADGPYFYVDPKEYERVLERWGPDTAEETKPQLDDCAGCGDPTPSDELEGGYCYVCRTGGDVELELDEPVDDDDSGPYGSVIA